MAPLDRLFARAPAIAAAAAIASSSEGAMVYTELFNVNGRVAMVSGTAKIAGPGVADALRDSVKTFVDQLRRDNP
jgi:hypothetical protein